MSSTAGRVPAPQDCYPLLEPARLDLPVMLYGERLISGRCFLAAVARVARSLPRRPYVFNLCTDRCRFLVGFAAALSRGQTTLLPPNKTGTALRRIQTEYPESYVLSDHETPDFGVPSVRFQAPPFESGSSNGTNPVIPSAHLAAVAFTSGTTGSSQACLKTWGLFCRSVDLIAGHLGVQGSAPHYALATVPPQHMYGLETTILLALRSAVVLSDRQAFFPADIHQALIALPTPRLLVTTPLHLRMCIEGGDAAPRVEQIVCATAPLSTKAAAEAEACFEGRLMEIFGFSEAGSVAVRHTASTDVWSLFDGLRILARGEEHLLSAPYLPEPVILNDRIELLDQRRFRLLGRQSEQVNIAGKRTSIAALNAALAEIQGVRDGVFFMPEPAATTERVGRLTAFVVAPGLSAAGVLAALRERIDPVFLPRPLYLVDSLPRLPNGKLARNDLETLAALCRERTLAFAQG